MIGLRSLPMDDQERLTRFESEMLPLMNDAYNLARWLVQNDQDAHDMVQEAFLRAFRYFSGMRGATSKAWLLRIVRNVCYDHLRKRQMLFSLLPCVAPAEFDADFVQPRFQCAVEFAIRGGQGVGQLLDAACAKNDRSNGRIRQHPSA